MIESLVVKGFSVLPESPLTFCRGLNGVMADAGGGKTHLLALLHALIGAESEKTVFRRLIEVLNVEHAKSLVRKDCQSVGAVLQWSDGKVDWWFSKQSLTAKLQLSGTSVGVRAVFLSSCRTFSVMGKVPVRRRELPEKLRVCLRRLEKVLGGKVEYSPKTGKVRLKTAAGTFGSEQLSAGQRQLTHLAAELVSGDLSIGGILFWDTPETGLHPKFLLCAAQCLVLLAEAGVQVFLATNSVVLVRELYLQQKVFQFHVPEKWTVLKGAAQLPEQTDDVWQLDTWTAFDMESHQTERFLAAE